MRQLIRTYSITGLHEITITGYTFTKQDIRLILDETLASAATTDAEMLASVLVSSTKKANVVSVVNGVITLASTTANLTVGDDLTIEIDIDNVAKTSDIPTVQQIQNGLAKQGSDTTKSITTLDEDLGDVASALEYMQQGGMPQIAQIAKQGSNANATLSDTQAAVKDGNDTAIGMLKDGTYGLAAIKNTVVSANQTITVDDSVTTIELQPNVLYIFTNRTANLTITLASGQPNVVNEYHMFIEIGATVPTITWPNTVNWILAFTPDRMTTAEISILNNSAIWV